MTTMILVRAFLEMMWDHLTDGGPAALIRLFARKDCPRSLVLYVLVGFTVGTAGALKLVWRVLESFPMEWLVSVSTGISSSLEPHELLLTGAIVVAGAALRVFRMPGAVQP